VVELPWRMERTRVYTAKYLYTDTAVLYNSEENIVISKKFAGYSKKLIKFEMELVPNE
jgi:hypothetical protein